MMPIETLTAFFTTSVLLALTPGPDNLFVLTQSALHEKMAGLLVTMGLCTGLIMHTSAVAFGVAVIFQVSILAFTMLKLFGAGYLLFLAWGAFRASATQIKSEIGNESLSLKKLYYRGIIMNVTNPKVSIFFLAFLPQFADPARDSMTLQIIILGSMFILSTLLVFGTIAVLAGMIRNWLVHSDKAQIIMNRVAGMVFIILALKLAITER